MLTIWSTGNVVHVEIDRLPVKGNAEFLTAVGLRGLRRQRLDRSQPGIWILRRLKPIVFEVCSVGNYHVK